MAILSLSTQEDILKIDTLSENDLAYKKIVADKIKELSEDENSRNLATDFGNIIQIIIGFTNYLKNDKSYLPHRYKHKA